MPHTHGARRIYQPLSKLLAHLSNAEAPKQCELIIDLGSSKLNYDVLCQCHPSSLLPVLHESYAAATPVYSSLYCMALRWSDFWSLLHCVQHILSGQLKAWSD